MSKCALCASVLLYSRDQCTVALGRCCSADACARSHRVYWAHCTVCAVLHCTVCAVLHCQHFVCCALHCTVCALLHCTVCAVPGEPATHCLTAPGQWAVELAMHRHTACGQWAVELLHCTATLPRGRVWCGVVWCAEGAVTKGQKAGMSTHG